MVKKRERVDPSEEAERRPGNGAGGLEEQAEVTAPLPALQMVQIAAPELDAIKAKAAERDGFLEKLQRVGAEYLNFQKRIARERTSWARDGNLSAIRDFLPVVENLERALESAARGDGTQAILEGLKLIKAEIEKLFKQYLVKRIATVGERFDPRLHEAVGAMESAASPGTILQEMRPGYMMGDDVIIPARVVVAYKGEEREGTREESEPTPEGGRAS